MRRNGFSSSDGFIVGRAGERDECVNENTVSDSILTLFA